MIIELNKHYINALGDVIFINKYIKGVFYPFRDVENNGYSSNGSYIYNYPDHKFDLICECVPDILDKYMDKDITQKEFIQQHIDYYIKVKDESVTN